MKKYLIILILIFINLILILLLINFNLTGRVIETETNNISTFTKAICDNNNYCQDYIIECEGNKTISIKSITGATIQFNPEWEDPRNEEEINRLC